MNNEQQETKKSNRGGARAGAGRKKTGRNIAITLHISEEAKNNLASYAQANGISNNEAASRIFENIPQKI